MCKHRRRYATSLKRRGFLRKWTWDGPTIRFQLTRRHERQRFSKLMKAYTAWKDFILDQRLRRVFSTVRLGKPFRGSTESPTYMTTSSCTATHHDDLEATLARCKEMGITLKLSKSTFAMPMIKWFGRTFTSNGVTADIGKVEGIIDEGRPKDIEEVRSLLMACQYNAKFAFWQRQSGLVRGRHTTSEEYVVEGRCLWLEQRDRRGIHKAGGDNQQPVNSAGV